MKPLVLPRHTNLTIEHQPQAVNYETVQEQIQYWESADYGVAIPPGERDKMIATGEIWFVVWFPDTPVGSCAAAASSLEAVLTFIAESEQ